MDLGNGMKRIADCEGIFRIMSLGLMQYLGIADSKEHILVTALLTLTGHYHDGR